MTCLVRSAKCIPISAWFLTPKSLAEAAWTFSMVQGKVETPGCRKEAGHRGSVDTIPRGLSQT